MKNRAFDKSKYQNWIDPHDVTPYERNAKVHNEKQIGNIVNSIQRFGWQQDTVLTADNVLVIGHGRRLAALKIGCEMPYHRIDKNADELTDKDIRELRIADNQTNAETGLDLDIFALEAQDLNFDGFDFDFSDILPSEPAEVKDDDYEPEPPEEPKSKPGDIYQLGAHRLMCGDSTDVNVIDRLMDGVKADMVFTDPPYNIGYHGVSDKRTVQNDKMDDERFVEFLKSSLMNCETMYVCCSWQYAHLFRRALEENGNKIKAMIVWDKVNPAQHLDKYFKQHEIIWYCGKFGGEKTLRGDIWQVKRQANTVHPTMKPIELIAMALQDNPDKKIVYDGFGGSGSTLIACEQLNRKCYMCEIDPRYVDVIIDRWEKFTGEKAVLLNRAE